jgi:hypothetical protein
MAKNQGLLIGLGVAAATAGIGFAIWKSQQPADATVSGLYGLGAMKAPYTPAARAALVAQCASMDAQMDAATTAYMNQMHRLSDPIDQRCGRERAVEALGRQLHRLNAAW